MWTRGAAEQIKFAPGSGTTQCAEIPYDFGAAQSLRLPMTAAWYDTGFRRLAVSGQVAERRHSPAGHAGVVQPPDDGCRTPPALGPNV